MFSDTITCIFITGIDRVCLREVSGLSSALYTSFYEYIRKYTRMAESVNNRIHIVSHFFDVYFAWPPLHSVAWIYRLWQIRGELWEATRYAHWCAAEVETAPTNATIRKDSKFVLDFAPRNIKNDAVVAELAHLPCTLEPWVVDQV